MVVKPSSWDLCPSMQALTRRLGKVQKLSVSGGNSYKVGGKGVFSTMVYYCTDMHRTPWSKVSST